LFYVIANVSRNNYRKTLTDFDFFLAAPTSVWEVFPRWWAASSSTPNLISLGPNVSSNNIFNNHIYLFIKLFIQNTMRNIQSLFLAVALLAVAATAQVHDKKINLVFSSLSALDSIHSD
jgi:hypothetical protein